MNYVGWMLLGGGIALLSQVLVTVVADWRDRKKKSE